VPFYPPPKSRGSRVTYSCSVTSPPEPPRRVEPARGAHWLGLALIGALGGLLSGTFGIGGGTVMVPLLVTFAGMDQRRAAATSLAAIIPSAIAGTFAYAASGSINLAAGACVAVGGVLGSYAGARLLTHLPLGWLRWMFIGLLTGVAVRMLIAIPPRETSPLDLTITAALMLFLLGLVTGVASGLFGIGGGLVMVPMFVAFFGMSDVVAKGTSLAVMIPTAISGTVTNWRNHLVVLRQGLLMGACATCTTFVGAWAAHLVSPAVAAWLFAGIVAVAAVQLAIRAVRAGRRK